MNDYLENIKSIDISGEQKQIDSINVLDVPNKIPNATCIDNVQYDSETNQEFMSYSAPQKVIVRIYRLRK